MKKVFLTALLFAILAACGSDSSKESSSTEETEKNAAPETVDITADPNYQKGLELMAKNDCGTCHEITEKKTGPSFREIATRYSNADEATVDSLAGKVIKGGSGNWAPTPIMSAHPNLSQEDAKTLVRYILLMKNQ